MLAFVKSLQCNATALYSTVDQCLLKAQTHRLRCGRIAPRAFPSITIAESGFNSRDLDTLSLLWPSKLSKPTK